MGNNVTDMGNEKKPVKHELKKHAATIHCSNTLSLLQRKISNALLYHAHKELLVKEEHTISIKQLCQLISYNGHNYAVIKDALKSLLSTVIEWNVVNDSIGCEDWTASSIIASVCLQGPTCYYAYSPRMKQLLHSPSMFGKINLYIQSHFKSSYGLALYENCIRYRGLPYTKWFDMETFRKLMGVPSTHYTIFRDFKRRVLDKSVEEVNTYSDLLVEPELARERRRVVRIRFALKERVKKIRLGSQSTDEQAIETDVVLLRSQLINQFGVSVAQAEQLLRDYTPDFLREKFKVVESSKNYKQGKIKNTAAYLLSAIKNDFKPAKSSSEVSNHKKREENRALYNLKELQKSSEQIEKAYKVYREQIIDQAISELDEGRRAHLMQQFQRHAEGPIETILKLQRKRYTQKNVFSSPQIKALLRQYVLQAIPEVRDQLLSIEKFVDRFSEKERTAWYQFKLVESYQLIEST